MDISIRIIRDNEQGYIIDTVEDAEEIVRAIGGTLSNTELIDPDKNKNLQINIDDSYTLLSLYNDICNNIGVEPAFAIDSDCPSNFDMHLELDNNNLISIDDFSKSLKLVLETFNTESITVYLQIVLGKGDVYRGDGIKMLMRAEPNMRRHEAHVHVMGGDDRSATIRIGKEIKYTGNLNKKEKKRAISIIKDNIDVLREMWKVLTIEGVSIDVDYKLGRISFIRL